MNGQWQITMLDDWEMNSNLNFDQGRRNRGGQGATGPPPDFPRFSIVVIWPNAQAAQGLLALAPPEFCTFRRPWGRYIMSA